MIDLKIATNIVTTTTKATLTITLPSTTTAAASTLMDDGLSGFTEKKERTSMFNFVINISHYYDNGDFEMIQCSDKNQTCIRRFTK